MKWLILRGLVREQRHWGDFPEHLRKSMLDFDPGVEVHMLDFPGFGTESNRTSPFTIDEIVDDVRGRWLRIPKETNEPCYLLAVSLGGMVAMNWSSRYPSDFSGVVLINSSATGLSPFTKRLKPGNYPRILSFFASDDVEMRERKILEMTTNLAGENLARLAKRHTEFAKKVRKKDALAQIVSAMRFKPPARIPIPLFVLGGKGDQLVDVSCSEKIASHFGGRLELHETANHDLATDDAPWIVGKLRDWIGTKSS
jgi:alpha-beta hydrolase superfamily lysophospholipase